MKKQPSKFARLISAVVFVLISLMILGSWLPAATEFWNLMFRSIFDFIKSSILIKYCDNLIKKQSITEITSFLFRFHAAEKVILASEIIIHIGFEAWKIYSQINNNIIC
jgi:hypothetical protein